MMNTDEVRAAQTPGPDNLKSLGQAARPEVALNPPPRATVPGRPGLGVVWRRGQIVFGLWIGGLKAGKWDPGPALVARSICDYLYSF
jgi:hypothetical protein